MNFSSKKTLFRGRFLAATLTFVFFLAPAWGQSEKGTQKLKVGVYPTTYTRLIAIADAKGFFKKNGLDVEIIKYPSGTAALEAVILGEVEIGTVVDFRFAWRMLEEPLIRAVASTGEVFESRIVARKDRGISRVDDLVGKRIGFVPNTISEYALHTFLVEHEIPQSDIQMVPLALPEQASAVIEGTVDAVSAFVTFSFQAVDGLGDNGVAWDSSFHTVYNALLVTRQDIAPATGTTQSFLKALLMAESYAIANPEEAKEIIQRDWGFSTQVIDQFWDATRVTISLNQSIVLSLNLYSKWLMERNDIEAPRPDVLQFIDTAPLDQVAPERVTLFR